MVMRRERVTVRPFAKDNPYGAIDFASDTTPNLDACIAWLGQQQLLFPEPADWVAHANVHENALIRDVLVGLPAQRCAPTPKAELERITNVYRTRSVPGVPSPTSPEAVTRLWADYRNGRQHVLELKFDPVSPDAIACYWPFHAARDRWGIYISVPRLLKYSEALCTAFAPKLYTLGNLETIVSCVLFEVFHHEFFHHIVESTATTLEILSASFGSPRPIYINYQKRTYETRLGIHPHEPLEEALANAYAHNTFAFLSRMALGYRSLEARLYQDVLRKAWATASEGYRDAGYYIGTGDASTYVSGAAQLFAMLLDSDQLDPASLLIVARRVMPRGHTAFVEKPDVPTHLVGAAAAVEYFLKLIPAPNETYTTLFWPHDTSDLDRALRERKKAEEAAARRTQRA